MTAYKLFVNNYDLSSATLQELRCKKQFLDLETTMMGRGLPTLDSLLIAPIQRLPRYRLLLEVAQAKKTRHACVLLFVCFSLILFSAAVAAFLHARGALRSRGAAAGARGGAARRR